MTGLCLGYILAAAFPVQSAVVKEGEELAVIRVLIGEDYAVSDTHEWIYRYPSVNQAKKARDEALVILNAARKKD